MQVDWTDRSVRFGDSDSVKRARVYGVSVAWFFFFK